MASECRKCGNKDNYNFALDIGLCNPCIWTELEQLQTKNEQLKADSEANLKMALKYKQQVDELTKRLGIDNPWHNRGDLDEIERLKETIKTQGKGCEHRHNLLCEVKEIIDGYFEQALKVNQERSHK